MTRAALYLRQSLDRTGEGQAVARQREDCVRLAEQKGWDVVRTFEDNDVSASSGRKRPGYESLTTAMQSGQIDAVVVWAQDRLHRRPVELEEFILLADSKRIALATVSGDIDLSTSDGRLHARLIGAFARAEVEKKGARQKRANLQRAQAGRMTHTRRPFGYADDGVTVISDEAAELKAAARAVLAGATLFEIVASLNNRGIKTSLGGRWTVTTLKRLLVNPRHAGLVTYQGKVTGVSGSWPAIIDTDTHAALCHHLGDPTRRTSPGTARKYLLSGMLACGKEGCTEKLFASPSGRPGNYRMIYRCRKPHLGRGMDLVDSVVIETVLERLARPDAASLLLDETKEDMDEVRQRAVALRGRLDEAASLFAGGTITGEQLTTITRDLKAQIASTEALLADANRTDILGDLIGSDDLRASWAGLTLGRKRAVIDTLFSKVTIQPIGRGRDFAPEQVIMDWR